MRYAGELFKATRNREVIALAKPSGTRQRLQLEHFVCLESRLDFDDDASNSDTWMCTYNYVYTNTFTYHIPHYSIL